MSPLRVPRTLIISDMHLGRPGGARSAAAFSALVSQFDRVIVNGDAAELHHVRYQRDAEHELERFRDGCVSRGIRLDFIAGNHDPFVTDVRSMSRMAMRCILPSRRGRHFRVPCVNASKQR